ncbi:hypothetical protein [Maribellus sediminis]|uniref:hypothetical protein n=1 Tax=Maribellus sediminis TaxID=2696285 RepID=UPI00142FFB27|nr:hypothetical protein [Maribellus sediminis]
MPVEIPVPITFNPYKHHFRFLLNELDVWRKQPISEDKESLLKIGKNLVDFYTGSLPVETIVAETLDYFRKRQLLSYDAFLGWLNPPHWKKIVLSDQSEWLIKQGDNPERFIHIHPAKYSKHSIRVRASTLKTVLALEILSVRQHPVAAKNLEAVNTARMDLLGLSPIKSLHKSESGIMRLWELFQNRLYT